MPVWNVRSKKHNTRERELLLCCAMMRGDLLPCVLCVVCLSLSPWLVYRFDVDPAACRSRRAMRSMRARVFCARNVHMNVAHSHSRYTYTYYVTCTTQIYIYSVTITIAIPSLSTILFCILNVGKVLINRMTSKYEMKHIIQI